MNFRQLISNQSPCRPFCKVARCAAGKSLAVSLARTDLSTGECVLCSTTGIFRRRQPACPGWTRAFAGLHTYSRSRDFRWSRKGPSSARAADRGISRPFPARRRDLRRDSRRRGSETVSERSSATISWGERRTWNVARPGTCRPPRRSPGR